MNSVATNRKSFRPSYGYCIGLLGIILVLLWLGIYKFTPTEAALIEPLVANSFLMSWLYEFFSVQVVSGMVGTIEILVGLALIWGLFDPKIGLYAGVAATVIFAATLSFLLTTPGAWKVSDGIVIANFFLVKDVVFLGMALVVVEKNWYIMKQTNLRTI